MTNDYYEALEPLATKSEACREFARNVGVSRPERAWILTDFDTWERNPHYTGAPVPHPEDESALAEYYFIGPVLPPPAPAPYVPTPDDEIPF